jgi:hypothetical protein
MAKKRITKEGSAAARLGWYFAKRSAKIENQAQKSKQVER